MAVFSGPEIVNDGLVLHLDAANARSYPGSGTAWSDMSVSKNSGTLINGVGFTSDNNGGFIFDGTNDYINFPNSSSLNIIGNNITLEVTYKNNNLPSPSHGDGLISKGSGSNDGQYEIILVQSGGKNKAYFRIYTMGVYSPGNILMDIGQIYTVCCVLDNKYMRIYVNGVEDGTGELKTNSIVSRTQSLTIGTRNLHAGTNSSAVNGTIYSAKVYNRALTPNEVLNNFEATRSRYGI
jgi:hypothetical protein